MENKNIHWSQTYRASPDSPHLEAVPISQMKKNLNFQYKLTQTKSTYLIHFWVQVTNYWSGPCS